MADQQPSIRYSISGSAAHSRLQPLMKKNWIDQSDQEEGGRVDFLWENAVRSTQVQRNAARCYSHLPNGTSILDSKWVLGRLLKDSQSNNSSQLAVLETHCFKGLSGFQTFSATVDLPRNKVELPTTGFFDLMDQGDKALATKFPPDKGDTPNLWVVKDAWANGAGGVWTIFGRECTPPLIESHSYVAQKYAWPPILYQHRKFHVRVYGCMTSDGRAFVHTNCFLHVANDTFGSSYDDTVHITNCCANSYDTDKFAGEICADLEAETHTTTCCDGQPVVIGLAQFFPSIKASMAALAQSTFPFLQGGEPNRGFEYLGLDFILSHRNHQPVAYLLEVNAPPSQDTATGLSHAETLHDTVLSDLLSLWVFPNVIDTKPIPGGWRCVYKEEETEASDIEPSKATILNKIRWTLFERKASKQDGASASSNASSGNNSTLPTNKSGSVKMATLARSMFPYFLEAEHGSAQETGSPTVFFENAGGTQVPRQVISRISLSLSNRHREKVGAGSVKAAKDTMKLLLGASEDDSIFLGPNATTLLSTLAQRYATLLRPGDEVIISIDNHLANANPWVQAAKVAGSLVKWWVPSSDDVHWESLVPLLSPKARLVAVPHASNILGYLSPIGELRRIVSKETNGYGRLIVDGVAAAPHIFPDVHNLQIDWYVVSLHKMCGPHLGALYGKQSAVKELEHHVTVRSNLIEMGTLNYEACEGVVGVGSYFASLSNRTNTADTPGPNIVPNVTRADVVEAYRIFESIEMPLEQRLVAGLTKSSNVQIIGLRERQRHRMLPVVAFSHKKVSTHKIDRVCKENGVVCRTGTFLSTERFQRTRSIDGKSGVLRLSLFHYNLRNEIDYLLSVLESIPGWF